MTNSKEKAEQEAREKMRAIALKNLNEKDLLNFAIAYLTQSNPGFGEEDNSAVDEFLYQPSLKKGPNAYDLKTGDKANLLLDGLLGSRKGGKRYTGQVSEYDMIESAAKIVQDSLGTLKVSDVISLLGSDVKIKDAYKNVYLGDLAKSDNKEYKQIVQTLIGGYMGYMTTQGVSKALGTRASTIKSGLENIVKEEDKK